MRSGKKRMMRRNWRGGTNECYRRKVKRRTGGRNTTKRREDGKDKSKIKRKESKKKRKERSMVVQEQRGERWTMAEKRKKEDRKMKAAGIWSRNRLLLPVRIKFYFKPK